MSYDYCPIDVNPNGFPSMDEKELIKHYGEPGKNQTFVDLPYPHKLSWSEDTVILRLQCHEKVADSVVRVLSRVRDSYSERSIKKLKLDVFGGCFNVRKMRGGSRYSLHSWGIALDYNPMDNRLRWDNTKAQFAKPEYEVWWQLWEEEGWSSLGRIKNYDWMHIQAAKI